MRAGSALFVMVRGNVVAGQRPAAGMALYIATFGKVAIDRHALIEYETLAVPTILLVGHLGEIT